MSEQACKQAEEREGPQGPGGSGSHCGGGGAPLGLAWEMDGWGGSGLGGACQVEKQQVQKLNDQNEGDVLCSLVPMCA